MLVFEITITNLNPEYKQIADDCAMYVYALERTGQILKREHIVISEDNTVKIPVLAPEKSSFSKKNNTKYVSDALEKIERNSNSKFQYVFRGFSNTDYPNYHIPKKSSFYILYYGYSSALICGDTYIGVPLYKIPETNHDRIGYDNIHFWENDYRRLFGLWLGEYENFAQEELQNVNSKINKRGREICTSIEKLTGVPTYYFLFNYRSCTLDEDLTRKCPVTNKDWLIANTTHEDFIAFKCDESRLVSELSKNCSDL